MKIKNKEPKESPKKSKESSKEYKDSKTPSVPSRVPPTVTDQVAYHISEIIKLLGEDAHREGLKRTPKRYAKAMEFLTSGYQRNIDHIVGDALFDEPSNEPASEIIIVRDIELFSLCEHHLLPFYGKAHVAYIPTGKIIGLSKIPRIVDTFARRMQVQERLTVQISNELMRILKAEGVAVIIEAFHLCMMMRGVEKQNSYTITISMLGSFRDDSKTRQELMSLLGGLGNRR